MNKIDYYKGISINYNDSDCLSVCVDTNFGYNELMYYMIYVIRFGRYSDTGSVNSLEQRLTVLQE